MRTFTTSPWSNGLITMTIICLIIILGLIVYLSYRLFFYSYSLSYQIRLGVLILILIIALLSSIALTPIGVSKDEHNVTVILLLKKIKIPNEVIENISSFPIDAKTFRILGIGNFFGNIGVFYNEKVGKFNSYVTDFSKSYVIYRKGKRPIVVTIADSKVLMEHDFKNVE